MTSADHPTGHGHPTTPTTPTRPTRIDRAVAREQAKAELDRARADRKAADRARRSADRAAGKTDREATTDQIKTVGPLLIVNGVAVYGQISYAMANIAVETWSTAGQVTISVAYAAAIETVALYIGWHAHDALLSKAYGTAATLRRYSYLLAAVVGVMNYSHFATGGLLHPTAGAIAMGMLSAISPWMWGLHTRKQQQVQLLREDRVDEAGVIFSTDRRKAFPFRSWSARRWALDHYVTDPRSAWEGYRADREQKATTRPALPTTDHPTTDHRPVEATTDHRPDPTGPTIDRADHPTTRPALTDRPDHRPAPTTRPLPPVDRPAALTATPTRPTTDHRPGKHLATPTVYLHSVPTDHPGPTDPTDPTTAWSATAIANAAIVREHFGPDRRPASVRSVRNELGWSADRATAAYGAYNAGADRPADAFTAHDRAVNE